jgi:hypothetical protein
MNQLKASIAKQNYINGKANRSIDLNYAQQGDYEKTLNSLTTTLQNLILTLIKNNQGTTVIQYTSNNFDLEMTVVNENYDFINYFSNKSKSYLPFFEAKECLKLYSKAIFNIQSFQFWMVYLTWTSSPYSYKGSLYFSNNSPLLSISFYDLNGVYLDIRGCDNLPITQYINFNNPDMVDYINSYRYLLQDTSKIFSSDSSFYTDPVFVYNNGTISNITYDQRLNYFLPITFSCDYFDSKENRFVSSGVSFKNLTNNYFLCESNHLSNFVVNGFSNPLPVQVPDKFFYLNKIFLFGRLVNSFIKIGKLLL